jgi:hypothetical protein
MTTGQRSALVTRVALPAERELAEVHGAEDDGFPDVRFCPHAFGDDRACRGGLAAIGRHVGAMEAVAL